MADAVQAVEPGWQLDLARAQVHRDYGRADFAATVAGFSDAVSLAEIADFLTAAPSRIARWVGEGRDLVAAAAGPLRGWSAYHVAIRYAGSKISRTQMVDAVTRWAVSTPSQTSTQGINASAVFDDIRVARLDTLIDQELYENLRELILSQPSDGGSEQVTSA